MASAWERQTSKVIFSSKVGHGRLSKESRGLRRWATSFNQLTGGRAQAARCWPSASSSVVANRQPRSASHVSCIDLFLW